MFLKLFALFSTLFFYQIQNIRILDEKNGEKKLDDGSENI